MDERAKTDQDDELRIEDLYEHVWGSDDDEGLPLHMADRLALLDALEAGSIGGEVLA